MDFKILFTYQQKLRQLDNRALNIGLASSNLGTTLDYVNLILKITKQKVEVLTQLKVAIKIFNNMSIRNKKIIVLKYKLGLTNLAIAHHLEIGERTVYKALEHIRQSWTKNTRTK